MLVGAALLGVVLVEAAMVGLVGAALVVVGAGIMGEVLEGDKIGESPKGSSALSSGVEAARIECIKLVKGCIEYQLRITHLI